MSKSVLRYGINKPTLLRQCDEGDKELDEKKAPTEVSAVWSSAVIVVALIDV